MSNESQSFDELEKHADREFKDLHKHAKRIAKARIRKIMKSGSPNPANELTRVLDGDPGFRFAIGCKDQSKLPREVDTCQRLLQSKLNSLTKPV
jgi:hypothetical protein